MFYKEIICLANSKKWQNRCIAGKDCENHKWVRPVSSRGKGALSIEEISFSNGKYPKLLEIIRIPLEEDVSTYCQPENIAIGKGVWEKIGTYSETKLDMLCDNPKTIWRNEGNKNDRISEEYVKKHNMRSSLLLINPISLKLHSYDNTYNGERKTRALFEYNHTNYNLGVTDLIIKEEYKKKTV